MNQRTPSPCRVNLTSHSQISYDRCNRVLPEFEQIILEWTLNEIVNLTEIIHPLVFRSPKVLQRIALTFPHWICLHPMSSPHLRWRRVTSRSREIVFRGATILTFTRFVFYGTKIYNIQYCEVSTKTVRKFSLLQYYLIMIISTHVICVYRSYHMCYQLTRLTINKEHWKDSIYIY